MRKVLSLDSIRINASAPNVRVYRISLMGCFGGVIGPKYNR